MLLKIRYIGDRSQNLSPITLQESHNPRFLSYKEQHEAQNNDKIVSTGSSAGYTEDVQDVGAMTPCHLMNKFKRGPNSYSDEVAINPESF